AHARIGDKGDTANIGVIARAPEIYPFLRRVLTAAAVKRRFKGICQGKVERHEVPNLCALNFLLHESLGGGGTVSLRLDAQGKTISHALLAPGGGGRLATLGADLGAGQRPQIVVPAGVWQGSRLAAGGGVALLGTTMAPGFDAADYETGEGEPLADAWPEFRDAIEARIR